MNRVYVSTLAVTDGTRSPYHTSLKHALQQSFTLKYKKNEEDQIPCLAVLERVYRLQWHTLYLLHHSKSCVAGESHL